MLVDKGFPGNQGMPVAQGGSAGAPGNTRDADRIMAVLKRANVTVLDYVVITHYHGDHAGNAAERRTGSRSDTSLTTAPILWSCSRTA
jgi:glyoxylase-like metal-dependent hydrolase (beta-lactamase superfamily II)